MAVPDVIEQPALRLGAGYTERFVEGRRCTLDSQIAIQDKKWLSHSFNHALGIISSLFGRPG